MTKTSLYPLKFNPILKERLWGGQKLIQEFGKTSQKRNIGESWEISDVEGDTSIVSEGILKGRSLSELIQEYESDLVGKRVFGQFGNKFPLLIKFIDAKLDLSIQLHPNDELAKERHDSFGKTEMWYIMDADPDSRLILGFKDGITKDDYLHHLNEKRLPEIVHSEFVQAGDAFFIEVGRVHAIGAGIMLAEIQQTSDITYRVYDWDRKDAQGNSRELHTELALDAIDFEMKQDARMVFEKDLNTANQIVQCPYFTTNYVHLDKDMNCRNDRDSFIIYICTEGKADFNYDQTRTELKKGACLLMPAIIEQYEIITDGVELMEVHV